MQLGHASGYRALKGQDGNEISFWLSRLISRHESLLGAKDPSRRRDTAVLRGYGGNLNHGPTEIACYEGNPAFCLERIGAFRSTV